MNNPKLTLDMIEIAMNDADEASKSIEWFDQYARPLHDAFHTKDSGPRGLVISTIRDLSPLVGMDENHPNAEKFIHTLLVHIGSAMFYGTFIGKAFAETQSLNNQLGNNKEQ